MSVRASCPACGKVEEYTPDEEDLKVAAARGVASISFNHGDHIFVIFFDARGRVRRTITLKAVAGVAVAPEARPSEVPAPRPPVEEVPAAPAAPTVPAIPFDDLCSLLGEEKLALMLAALASGTRVVLASSSLDLARNVASTASSLLGPIEVSVGEAATPEELKAACEGEGGAIVMTRHATLVEAGALPSGATVIDLEVPVKLSRKERKGLKMVLKALRRAGELRDDATKRAFVRSKVLRLRTLLERALEVLDKVDRIGEAALRRKVDPAMAPEELDALYFILERFRGIDVSRRVLRGPAEFTLRF
ncbi:hypothetical protein DRO33_05125 [Candidatus Bathyarchaeota archaeon]|nr:MAG: hypothetical protein DRO33_05125 [Candidatus Bathyarchaeota archaeon]